MIWLVVIAEDLCAAKNTCQDCVCTIVQNEVGNEKCVRELNITDGVIAVVYSLDGCKSIRLENSTTHPPATSKPTTTAPPPTTVTPNTTTPSPTTTPPANSKTTAPTSTTTAPTNGTTIPKNTTASTNRTTTTPAPTDVITTVAPPTPKPATGGFASREFFGEIVFAIALTSLAYLIWLFYKVRMNRNYHNF